MPLSAEEEERLKELENTPQEVKELIQKDYSEILNEDPYINSGTYLARHCEYYGTFNNTYYEEAPLLDLPLEDSQIQKYYSSGGILRG